MFDSIQQSVKTNIYVTKIRQKIKLWVYIKKIIIINTRLKLKSSTIFDGKQYITLYEFER